MKRILIFSLSYVPHVGGAEIAVQEITNRISDLEFHLLTLRFHPDDLEEEQIKNVHIHRIGNSVSYLSKILFVPRAAYAAASLNRKHHFDAFWVMMSYMLFPVVLLRLFGNRTPYILTLQEGDPWEHMFRRWFILPFMPLLKYGFRHASFVTAISTYLAEWAKRMGYRNEVRVIPNGVDTSRFDGAGIHSRITDPVTLVTTSRLVKKNAVDDVIRALAFLPVTEFRIYGKGPEEERLKALAQTLHVDHQVKFLGHIGHEQLPKALADADIFVRPSRSEGMGNSFIEAMIAGLPVVATQEGGIADFLYDAKRNPDKETTGWAVDKNSPGQVAEAVEDIITHPEQVVRVTAAAKHLVLEKYDWNLIARHMREVFATIGA